MWQTECDNSEKCIVEAQIYNKKRHDKSHQAPDFKEGDQVLISKLKFNNLKGPKQMRDSFLGPFKIIRMLRMKAVEIRLTEEFSRKHTFFPVMLVKPYSQTDDNKFPNRKNIIANEKLVKEND
ncbi:hypothetical protein O181_015303 [Austropuccinia psidii MF-1]|uniref:Uncharacterized protein n=1 Tax=Austropuccinia psidii MF-1 TaxID=1389203 RepID=A0A9Q3C2Z7_9BASI|nr:hypothetical protein [Austropuccinia psidii MF-1]